MGKLVVTEFITLDGVISDPGGAEGTEQGGWSFRHPAPEGQQYKGTELEAADAQLLGRVTYQGFAAAWPQMEEQTGEFGKKMNAMPKYVVSTTMTEADATWNNTEIIAYDVAARVEPSRNGTPGASSSLAAPHSWPSCTAPLLEKTGIGPLTAAICLTAWSHHGRSAPKPRSPPLPA